MIQVIKMDIKQYSRSVFAHMVRKSAEEAAVKTFGPWKDKRQRSKFMRVVDKNMFAHLVAAQMAGGCDG